MLNIRKRYFNKFICLQRKGAKRFPIFSIILRFHVKNSKIFLEKLGHYNPNFSTRRFFLNVNRLAYWLQRGVILSSTVKKLLVKFLV